MLFEQIPSLMMAVVRSVYDTGSVDSAGATLSRFWGPITQSGRLADIPLVLSQVSLTVCVILAAVILYVAIQRRALKDRQMPAAEEAAPHGAPAAVPGGVLRGRWDAILHSLDSTRETDWKIAVIEADKLVDDALARAGFPGETFGDRLSNIGPGTLVSLDGVWWAHKVRNRLAHDVDYFLRYTEARQAVGYFEAALNELQLI